MAPSSGSTKRREAKKGTSVSRTSSTPSSLAWVISLLEAKWGKLKAPYRRRCCSPGCLCPLAVVENRVDGARSFKRLCLPINHCTRLSRDLDCLYSWKSRCIRRNKDNEEIFRRRDRSTNEEREKKCKQKDAKRNLIFIIDETRNCEIYSYGKYVLGRVRVSKNRILKNRAIFNCSQEEKCGMGGRVQRITTRFWHG